MNAKFFLDTNIFIYSFDNAAPYKQKTAIKLLEQAFMHGNGVISAQVVQECLNFMTQKSRVKSNSEDTNLFLNNVLEPLCKGYLSTLSLYRDALLIKERWRYSFYDCLIIAGALKLKCEILYTEDLQHQQKVESLTIINPFLS